MLTHLKLENFKIWRSTGPMRLAPLTLLLGTNSSGKSSLIQSLLLMRQTVKGNDAGLDLNLGNPDADDTVTMGQFRDLLCRHGQATETTPDSQVGIEFRWQPHGSTTADTTLFSARYRAGPAGSAELDALRLGQDGQGFTVLRRKPGIYRLQLATRQRPEGQSADFRPERSFAFSAATLNKLGPLADEIRPVGPALLDELSRIIYLGPVRQLARRDYVWSGRMPAHIGDDGGRAVDVLIASGVAQQAKPGSAGEADGTFNLNIQDPNDDTIRFSEARYDIDYAVCNTPFGMTVNSANGGLETSATTSDNAFLSLVPYKVQFRFDGVGGTVDATQGTTLVDSSTEARAGSAHVTVRVPARDKLLLEGTYSDFLIASLVPNMGS